MHDEIGCTGKNCPNVLQFTKLDTVFAIYKNETEALQHFAKSSRF